MKWSGTLTIDSADFNPIEGEVTLSMMFRPWEERGEIVACEVSLANSDGVEVRYGKKYRVTVEEEGE